jgi:hypothetical protein
MDGRYRNLEETLKRYDDVSSLSLQERIAILTQLGEYIHTFDEKLEACMQLSFYENKWFTLENQREALTAIATHFLDQEKLVQWARHYAIQDFTADKKTIGLVMAGNIPLVGWHDVLSVFITGNKALIKLSDKDKRLLPYLVDVMKNIDPRVADYFEFSEMLKNIDAVIATGSNNTARYFEAYFAKYPNIIRKNRNAIAILDGSETNEELVLLGHDIFKYFGLGCRNVSKVYLPKGYVVEKLCEVLHDNFKEVVLHDKYKNNFDYNYAIFALNRTPFLTTGGLIVTEEKSFQSRIAVLHYEFYDNPELLENQLLTQLDDIQCVATWVQFKQLKTVPLGATQQPSLLDYPDGVDVVAFLMQ